MEIKSSRRVGRSNIRALTLVYFFALIQATLGILTEQPENTVVMLNYTATIKCKSNENRKLQWHSFGNESQEEVLWSGYFLNPKACSCPCCKIDNHEPGKYNLNITGRKETAKRYRCTEPGTLMRVSADLIVIESALNCTYNETAKDVTLRCVIGVYGEWAPQIRWNKSDEGHVEETSVPLKNGQVISTLFMPLTTEEVFYTATVYFRESDKPAEVTATNVPSYPDEWKSPSFKLHVPPSNITAIALCCSGLLLAGTIVSSVTWMRIKSRKTNEGSVPEEKNNWIKA